VRLQAWIRGLWTEPLKFVSTTNGKMAEGALDTLSRCAFEDHVEKDNIED
jgi:hypothetical protein